VHYIIEILYLILRKNNYAKSKGYDLIILWEKEINDCNDEELKTLLIDKLSKYERM